MNPLSTLLAYYRNFWNVYKLAQNANQVPVPEQTAQVEKISLILMDGGDITSSLTRLSNQTRQPDELIIVLRTPPSELKPALAAPSTIVTADGISAGAARNRGIAAAHNPIVVVMESTLHPQAGLISALTKPLEVEPAIALCAPQLASSPFWSWLSQPYEAVSPLASWQALAFRKIEWARVGGIPEDISPFAAWSVFLAKLLGQKISFCQSTIETDLPVSSPVKFTAAIAQEEGSLGLAAHWMWRQVKFALLVLTLLGLTVLLFILSPWFGLTYTAMALVLSVIWLAFWGRKTSATLSPLFAGWLALVRFMSYLWGVRRRAKTLPLLNLQAERHLKEIVSTYPDRKGIVVYFPTHDWGNMFQRPHQIARQFARAGYLFFFGTPNKIVDFVPEFQQVEPNLYLASMPAIPPETFRVVEPLILYIGAAWYAPMLDILLNCQVIYDHYDDLQVSGGSMVYHERLLKRSNIILASSRLLMEAVQRSRPDALFIPNAVDDEWVRRFEPEPGDAAPSDLAEIQKSGKPIIGYSGALAEWFDYPLLTETAKLLPDFEFVLLGISYDYTLEKSGVLDLPNIHWLGQKPYADLFHYVWRFDVAMIPFCINDITLATSPIKLYEYFCCGKPVVSTALPEVMRYNEALIAENAAAFAKQIQKALTLSTSTAYQEAIQAIARANTWEGRVRTIIGPLTP
ncbi:MAG: glycosyltransferase [Anaerolineales bacterium]|nr:glycosyltransferase [Anaerolineales bacterium]